MTKTIFLYFQAPRVQITFDDKNLELSALMVSVMNGRRMGGGFMMAPEGRSNDGLFDVCIAQEVNRPQIFSLITKFMAGTQDAHPAIQRIRTNHLSVTALHGTLPAHADGETLCIDGTQLDLTLLSNPIELIYKP